MRIGELARRAGVNVETVRYYERRGLLPEPPRGPAGHRSYDEDAVRFVRAIKETQALGFTLAEIQDYLRLARRSDGSASATMRVRLAAKIDEIDARLGRLQRIRDELARVIGCACDSLDHCTCGAAYLARRGADPDPDPALILHVTNGESAGNTLRETGLGGAVLPWQDVLHEGPVPDATPARLREIRAAFLSGCGWGSKREILHSFERRDELFARALAERRDVVLWFEHDLFDQLQLIQILARAAETDYQPERLELIVVGSFEGKPDFHGLGELTADELESLWSGRHPAGPAEVELAAAAWRALVSPEPTTLRTLLAADTTPLPFLSAAVERFLEELPDTRSGLSRTERQLLEAIGDDVLTPMELFIANQAREEAPFAGDAWIWTRMAELAGGEHPLIELADGGPFPHPPPLGEARAFKTTRLLATSDGRAVLAGTADRVELLGIDRWLGGTHVTPENLWRRDSTTGAVIGSDPVG